MPKIREEDERTIHIIEPHPDDAYLSLGWHIEKLWKEKKIVIHTVYSDEKRTKEAEAYAAAVGATSNVIGLEESKMLSDYRKVEIPELVTLLKSLKNETVIAPLGIQHPDHLNVARICKDNRYGYSLQLYVDTPYQCKQKNLDSLAERVSGRSLRSICFPPKAKWKHNSIYKSQGMFFHYNPLHEYKIPEMILG